ncbi:MAG: hypothetical protein IPH16_02725 [Haliscomenobacter sp.]|nr:hypothetical protein [Haliscomenobacter sp.]
MSFLAGEFFGRPRAMYPRFVRLFMLPCVAYPVIALFLARNWLLQTHDYIDRPDVPSQMAREIKSRLDAGMRFIWEITIPSSTLY